MTEMEPINLRVEEDVESQVEILADNLGTEDGSASLSEAARELIYVGLGLELGGGIRYEGPLGVVGRPFAGANFEGETVSIGTRLPPKTVGRLEGAFQTKKHPAAREALRTGLIFVQIDEIEIRGPLDVPRPFAQIDVEGQIQGERAQEALRTIRAAIPEE